MPLNVTILINNQSSELIARSYDGVAQMVEIDLRFNQLCR